MSAPFLPSGAETQPDGRVRYPLAWPIRYQLGNTEMTVDHVTVRRKVLADNRAIGKLPRNQTTGESEPAEIANLLITRLTGLEQKVADQLDDEDQEAIGAIIESFSTPGRPTPTAVPG